MEDVRSVLVDEETGVVVVVVGVAGDVGTLLHHEHLRPVLARQPLGQHAAGEPGADNQ